MGTKASLSNQVLNERLLQYFVNVKQFSVAIHCQILQHLTLLYINMSQKTLNSYFSVKKRPVNQHAAKSRKLETSQVSNPLSL